MLTQKGKKHEVCISQIGALALALYDYKSDNLFMGSFL